MAPKHLKLYCIIWYCVKPV